MNTGSTRHQSDSPMSYLESLGVDDEQIETGDEMGIHLNRTGAKRAAEKTGFAAIEGHRHLIDVDAIKKGNAARKHARLLSEVADGVAKLHEAVSQAKTRQRVHKLLSEEN